MLTSPRAQLDPHTDPSFARPRLSRAVGWLIVLLAAALAAALRLYRLDLIDFRFDQAYPLQYAQDIARGYLWGVQPHGSVASHPAAYLYVMALPYLFTHNFVAIAAYRILLDVAAVALCAWIGLRYFNARVALISAILFATGPWAIQFARNFWPVPQPLFSCIALLGLIEIVQRKNPWGWAMAGLGLALTAGAHLGGLYALPVGLIAYGLGCKSFRPLPALLGALPGALVIAAYLLHDGAEGFGGLRAYASALSGGSSFSWNPALFAAWFSGGLHLADLTGAAYAQWQASTSPLAWIDTLQVLLLIAAVLGVGLHLALAARRSRKPAALDGGRGTIESHDWAVFIVWLWLVLPVLLQLRSARPVMLQYMPVLLPAPFLLMALATDWVWRRAPSRAVVRSGARAVVVIALASIVGWQIYSTLHFADFIDGHDTPNGYGLPVRGALAARNAVSAARADDVLVVIKGFPTPWNEQAAILRSVMADLPYRFLNSESDGLLLRPEQTHYVFAPGADALLQNLLVLYAGNPDALRVQRFPSKVDGTGYTHVWLRQPLALGAFTQQPHPVWANHVELLGYRVSPAAPQSDRRIELILRVLETPPPDVDYHWTLRLRHGERQLAQRDIAGVHPASWRAGDWVYLALELPYASDPAITPDSLWVGSYTYPQVSAVMVSIPGQPASDGVALPLTNTP